jgi:hypothetical protein
MEPGNGVWTPGGAYDLLTGRDIPHQEIMMHWNVPIEFNAEARKMAQRLTALKNSPCVCGKYVMRSFMLS